MMLRRFARFDQPRPAARAGALQAIYDAAATSWQDGISRLGFDAAYHGLMQDMPPPAAPAARVMDVGTGTGAFASAWIDTHGAPGALTLTDISPAMLDVAATRLPDSRAIVAPLGAPLADVPGQDVVLCAHVIEHLADPEGALRWLHDRLNPGGRLVLAMSRPHWCTALVRWRWGNAAYTPEHATAMLGRAGFTAITSHAFPSGPPARVSCGYIAWRP